MSYSQSQVIIEPYCIFCGGHTQNVVRHTLHSGGTVSLGAGGSYSRSESTTVPVPAHQACYQRRVRLARLGFPGLLILAIPICLVFFDLGFKPIEEAYINFIFTFDPTGLLVLSVLLPVAGGVMSYLIFRQLDEKVRAYYRSHRAGT